MEKKMKRIPFDLELAKAITKGEKDGRIVTRCNQVVTIKHIIKDVACDFPVICVIGNKVITHTKKGRYQNAATQSSNDLFLEVPDVQEFEEGDVITYTSYQHTWISIFKGFDKDLLQNYTSLSVDYPKVFFNSHSSLYVNPRLTTPEEKQLLIDALKKDGSGRAKEYLKRFFGIKIPYTFKAGEEVLVRGSKREAWNYTLYNRPHSKGLHLVVGHLEAIYDCHILPYNEQTKHLLGTTDDWEG